MRIKRVEIIGFKSFCDRAVVHIDAEITGVVGPNGCGKSNIVDAIRWAMGEQSAKHLRGKAMEDVIFAGSETRGPAPMAEVSLTFDDVGFSHETLELAKSSDERAAEQQLDALVPDGEAAEVEAAADGEAVAAEPAPQSEIQREVDEVLADKPPAMEFASYTEVTITRRLYRDGLSQYYINKTPCRLRDITDFFLGTGVGTKAYAIIEQGRIGQIVSARPQDRRAIIEEAAGITKFKAKKKAAEKKLDQTRQNLMRVSDIVVELDKRMGTLRRQAQKAERYRKYKGELKDIELWKASHRWLELHSEGSLVGSRLGEVRTGVEDTRAQWMAKDAHVVAERAELSVEERRLVGIQEHVYELDNRLRLAESKIEFERREADELDSRIATARTEITEVEAQRERGAAELAARDAELASLAGEVDRELAEVTARETAAADARTQLTDAQTALDEARQELAARRTEIATADAQLEALGRRREEAARRLERVMTETEQHVDRSKELDREGKRVDHALASLRQTRLDLGNQTEGFGSRRELLADTVARGEAEVETLRTELHRRRSRLTSLVEIQERYEGFQRGTRAVMQGADEIVRSGDSAQRIRGVVADVVRAPEQLEVAVEAVLGDRLGGVLVEEPEVGVAAIGFLKQSGGGRSAFVPLSVPAKLGAVSALGAVDVVMSDFAPASTTARASDAPAVDAPVVDAPAIDAPAVDAPVVDAAAVDAPVDAPAMAVPAIDAPATDAPAVDAPVDAPAMDVPVDAPAMDVPAMDAQAMADASASYVDAVPEPVAPNPSSRFEGEGGAASWMSPAWSDGTPVESSISSGWSEPVAPPREGDVTPAHKIEFEDRSELIAATNAIVGRAGVLGRMSDLVGFADGYDEVGKRLLADTVVVEDLRCALALHGEGITDRLVTLDGDVVDGDGVVAGGSRDAQGAGVLAQKREIRDLEEIVGKLEHDLGEAMQRLVTAKTELAHIVKALEGLRTQVHQGDVAIMGHEKDDARVRAELERHRERLVQLGNEQLELEHRLRAIEIDDSAARERRTVADERIAQLEREQLELVSRLATHREHLDALVTALTEARVRAAQLAAQRSAAEASSLRLRATDAELVARGERLAHEIDEAARRGAELRADCETLAAEVEVVRTERTTRTDELDAGRLAYDARLTALTEVELTARELRGEADRLQAELGQLELRNGQIAMTRQVVEDGVSERYQIAISAVLYDYHQRPHITDVEEARLAELKDLIERMGTDINLTAIEEFDEVSKRFEFLSSQKGDLERAVDQLQRAIDKINKTSRKLFRDTFAAVNQTFKEVFPRLFRGGQAALSLSTTITKPDGTTTEVDLLEAGIEIMAQPPGKKNATVDQLSGGEKALTAVALVFSIFLIKPSPFCILDEVDAPLDEANVDRYNEIVREMTDRSQFIVITHNKRTMESADNLYGVTMQEPGVSKLVNVNLAKIGSKPASPNGSTSSVVAI